jgi:hypothetical protein
VELKKHPPNSLCAKLELEERVRKTYRFAPKVPLLAKRCAVVEELRTVARLRHDTRVEAPKPAVPSFCDDVVQAIEESGWQELEYPSQSPNAAERSEHGEYRSTFGQYSFIRRAVVHDHIHGIQITGAAAVALEKLAGERALERRETKSIARVSLEDKSIQVIAEPADAIVENEISHRFVARQRISPAADYGHSTTALALEACEW